MNPDMPTYASPDLASSVHQGQAFKYEKECHRYLKKRSDFFPVRHLFGKAETERRTAFASQKRVAARMNE